MNWRIAAYLAAFLGTFYAGWHGHTWYDAYLAQNAKDKAIASLGNGQSEIVKFNQKFDKEKSIAKNDCVDKPMPAGIVGLLH